MVYGSIGLLILSIPFVLRSSHCVILKVLSYGLRLPFLSYLLSTRILNVPWWKLYGVLVTRWAWISLGLHLPHHIGIDSCRSIFDVLLSITILCILHWYDCKNKMKIVGKVGTYCFDCFFLATVICWLHPHLLVLQYWNSSWPFQHSFMYLLKLSCVLEEKQLRSKASGLSPAFTGSITSTAIHLDGCWIVIGNRPWALHSGRILLLRHLNFREAHLSFQLTCWPCYRRLRRPCY